MSSTFTFRLSYKNTTIWQVGISLKAHEEDVNTDDVASSTASDDDDR